MARFNSTSIGSTQTTNYEGDFAYSLSPELELYSLAATSMLADKFYESTGDRIDRLRGLISRCDPEFVAKLAIYSRNEMYLRSIPIVLTVELAKLYKGKDLILKMTEGIIQRADEITELLSYYAIANNRTDVKKLNKLSKQIQKGIANSFNKFDEYQFGKYNGKKTVSLKDALFLSHPKPKDEAQQIIFNKIAKDELAVPYTWETELSEAGKSSRSKKEVWEKLIESKKVGYMALLRNLRNILEAGVSIQHVGQVCQYLSTPDAVRKSKQLPFRFLSAYNEISEVDSPYSSTVMNALEDAVMASAENIKGYDYNTTVIIACDVSGSMESPISERSMIMNYDIGLLLGMLMQSKYKAVITGIFGKKWAIKQLPQKAILQNVKAIRGFGSEVGHSTNGYLALQDLRAKNIIADKIMVFTDCQLWNSNDDNCTFACEWSEYKKIAPQSKLYLFDLAGYGNTPISVHNKDVYFIAGFSDKIFDALYSIENGNSIVKQIMGMKI